MSEDLKDLFEKYRDRYADLQRATYLGPDGLGMHRVRLLGSNLILVVAGAQGSTTFAPGDIVIIGTFSGRRQRVIIGFPPAGDQGGSQYPAVEQPGTVMDNLIVSFITPRELEIGALNQPVYVCGYGLSESPLDIFTSETHDADDWTTWVASPWATIHDPEWVVDPSAAGLHSLLPAQRAVKILVDLDADTPADYLIPLRVRRSEEA